MTTDDTSAAAEAKAVIDHAIAELQSIRARLDDPESGHILTDDERVDEADNESFPASDPPSFNPGHT